MQITSGISNLNSIPTRSHSVLQNLTNNDHPWYSAEPNRIALTSFTTGLDASKSGTPAVGNVYYATDSVKLYECFATNVWTQVSDIAIPAGAAQGDTLYFDGTKWNRLAAGTSGLFLQTQGAGANPLWAGAVASYLRHGLGSGTNYQTGSTSYVDVDSTNLKVTVGGLTIGKPIRIIYTCQTASFGATSTNGIALMDVTNSVAVASANITSSTTSFFADTYYTAPSTSIVFSLQYKANGSNVLVLDQNVPFTFATGSQIAAFCITPCQ